MKEGNTAPQIGEFMENWIGVCDRLPQGQWSINHSHWSEEVLIANSCSISIGYYDRDNCRWYVSEGTFGKNKIHIDKITHWMPLPHNPYFIKEVYNSTEFEEEATQYCRDKGWTEPS